MVEAASTVLMLTLALATPRLGAGWVRRGEGALRRLARHRGVAIALVGVLAFGGSAAV